MFGEDLIRAIVARADELSGDGKPHFAELTKVLSDHNWGESSGARQK